MIELTSVDNTRYYINQITNDCVVDKPMIDDVCGGVICEDMVNIRRKRKMGLFTYVCI